MSTVDDVKLKTDIVEIIGQYTTLTKSGRTFRGLCPFHSEKRPSFFVYPEQQTWHCFGACSTGGDVFSFIMKKENIDFGEALRLLANKAGIELVSRTEPEVEKRGRFYQMNEAAAMYFHNVLLNSSAGEKARRYLEGRGISQQTITSFQLGFSPENWEALKQHLLERGYEESELTTGGLLSASDSGHTYARFRGRLMFPIMDIKGRTTGFGGRVLDDSYPKYLNSPQTPAFDKSGSLYAINLASSAIRKQDTAVIVEGYMDAITAHQYGFTNVVASMGTAIAEKQIAILKKLTRNLVLALDSDTAGQEASLRGASYENMLGAEVKVMTLPAEHDPDTFIKDDSSAWPKLITGAIPVLDFTFSMASSGLNLSTARDKSLIVEKLLPVLYEIKDPIRQPHYLQKLARLVGVSERSMEAALRRYKQARPLSGVKETATPSASPAVRSMLGSRTEEYFLCLILQHPELKDNYQNMRDEYFNNSENREIFAQWCNATDISSLKAELDSSLHEHLDSLLARNLPPPGNREYNDILSDCILRLREEYLRSLAARHAEMLVLERETGGTTAELARQEEQGTEVSAQLGEIFSQKGRRR